VTSLSLCLDNSEIWSQTLGCLLFYEGFTTFILEPVKQKASQSKRLRSLKFSWRERLRIEHSSRRSATAQTVLKTANRAQVSAKQINRKHGDGLQCTKIVDTSPPMIALILYQAIRATIPFGVLKPVPNSFSSFIQAYFRSSGLTT
jgi:hypothetical protein